MSKNNQVISLIKWIVPAIIGAVVLVGVALSVSVVDANSVGIKPE